MPQPNRIPVTEEIQINVRTLIRNSQRWFLEEVLELKKDEYQEIRDVAVGDTDTIDEDLNTG